VAKCLSGWEWNQNSLGQDPCWVSTILDANCRNQPNYTRPKVGSGQYYIPPKKATAGDLSCDCDTVMYSLVMACSTCQTGIAYGWDLWVKQCDTVLISDYSGVIPKGTAIPHWAYYNVTLLDNQEFDNNKSQSIGRDPEAKPPPLKGSTGSGKKGMSKKTGAIICGAVGGVCLLIMISIGVYLGLRWRRKAKERELRGQWDYPGGYDSQRKTSHRSPTLAMQNPSFSTGPALVSDFAFQPYVPPQAQGQSNPTASY